MRQVNVEKGDFRGQHLIARQTPPVGVLVPAGTCCAPLALVCLPPRRARPRSWLRSAPGPPTTTATGPRSTVPSDGRTAGQQTLYQQLQLVNFSVALLQDGVLLFGHGDHLAAFAATWRDRRAGQRGQFARSIQINAAGSALRCDQFASSRLRRATCAIAIVGRSSLLPEFMHSVRSLWSKATRTGRASVSWSACKDRSRHTKAACQPSATAAACMQQRRPEPLNPDGPSRRPRRSATPFIGRSRRSRCRRRIALMSAFNWNGRNFPSPSAPPKAGVAVPGVRRACPITALCDRLTELFFHPLCRRGMSFGERVMSTYLYAEIENHEGGRKPQLRFSHSLAG